MAKVNLEINGRKYALGCDDGEEVRLERLGQELDERIKGLANQFGQIGDLRLLVMAGITMTDEISEMQGAINEQAAALTADIRKNSDRAIREAEASQNSATDSLMSAAEQIEKLAASLNISSS